LANSCYFHLMKNTTPPLLVILFVIVSSCSKPAPPQVIGLTNIKSTNTGADTTVVSAGLLIYNPNNYAVNLKKAEAEIFVNNQLSGSSYLDTLLKAKAKDTLKVPVKILLQTKKILNNGLGMLLGEAIEIKFLGKAMVGRSGFYTTVPFEYTTKQKLSDLIK
jgi:LEA14-like dessication related protein